MRPGSSKHSAWLGMGCAEEGLGGPDKKSHHSRAVGPSPRGRELLRGLLLRARARTRLWLLTHTGARALCIPRVWGASSKRMHPSPSPGVGGGLLTCYEHNVRFKTLLSLRMASLPTR